MERYGYTPVVARSPDRATPATAGPRFGNRETVNRAGAGQENLQFARVGRIDRSRGGIFKSAAVGWTTRLRSQWLRTAEALPPIRQLERSLSLHLGKQFFEGWEFHRFDYV